jgi:hypothetical protein
MSTYSWCPSMGILRDVEVISIICFYEPPMLSACQAHSWAEHREIPCADFGSSEMSYICIACDFVDAISSSYGSLP